MIGFQKRIYASLLGNVIRGSLSFVTAILLARWLGPHDYGRMAFLMASFVSVKSLLDMASSSAFFTFLSQKPRSPRFVNYYWRFILCQFLFVVLILGVLTPSHWVAGIWHGESRILVILTFAASFMQGCIWSVAAQMAEAERKTLIVQKTSIIVTAMHLGIIFLLWKNKLLYLPLIFIFFIFEYALSAWFVKKLYRGTDNNISHDKDDTLLSVFDEFRRFCTPFLPYVVIGFIYEFGDRWMLQNWGGPNQQAYYALALQFSTVVLLATTAILQVFWKEIAEAHYQGDREKVKSLYQRVSRGLFFLGALSAGLFIPWSDKLVSWILGSNYVAGSTTMVLMFLYPVHQSMGQINGTMFYATGHTRLYTNLGIIFMTVSLIIAYFVMAPTHGMIPGLGMGSNGLALKMVGMQFIQVNILAYFIAKKLNWEFDYINQFKVLIPLLSIGFISKKTIEFILNSESIFGLCLSSLLTIFVSIICLMIKPGLAGLTKQNFYDSIIKYTNFYKSCLNKPYA